MLDLSKIDHIYLVTGATDLRKSADGCSAVVQYDLEMNPFAKDIFIFCNKRKTTIQILEWDNNGFWIHKKKLLGKDRYRWPKAEAEQTSILIDERQLEWLLSGLEVTQKYAHHKVVPIIEKCA